MFKKYKKEYRKGTLEGIHELIFECNTELIKDTELKELINSIRKTIYLLESRFGIKINKQKICKQLFKLIIK